MTTEPDDDHRAAPPGRDRLVRVIAFAGVPVVITLALAALFFAELGPGGRLLVIAAGGVATPLALVAPWLLSRRAS